MRKVEKMEMEATDKVKKRRKIWAAVVAGVVIFIAGFMYHLDFHSFDVRSPALTERENRLAMGSAWLFEVNPGNYELKIYHYQYGYLMNTEDFTLIRAGGYDNLLVEQRDFLAIRAARDRDDQLVWSMSIGVGISGMMPVYDISEFSTMGWGSIENSIRLGDNEVPILYLSVSDGVILEPSATIFSPNFRFKDHIEALADGSNYFIVSVRRVG